LGAAGRAFKSPRPDHRINGLQTGGSRICVSGSTISLFEAIESALCVKRCVRTVSELFRQRREFVGTQIRKYRSPSAVQVWSQMGNGDGQDDSSYQGDRRKLFQGASSWHVHQGRVDQPPLRRELHVDATWSVRVRRL